MWTKEFLHYLSPPSFGEVNIEKAFSILKENVPKSLFKYRAVNDNSIINLKTNTVWLSSANKYSDPYDSSIKLSMLNLINTSSKVNFDDMVNHAKLRSHFNEDEIEQVRKANNPVKKTASFLLRKNSLITKNEYDRILSALEKVLKNISDDMIDKFNDHTQKGIKICSFSTKNNSIIMWSHYARRHTGFCIEYDFTQLPANDVRWRLLFPVIYSRKRFDATPYFFEAIKNKSSFNILLATLAALYKSPEWSYEKEWRLIVPLGTTQPSMNYSIPSPKAIYLGSLMKEEDKKTIGRIGINIGASIYEMRLSNTKFKLEIKEITKTYNNA